MSLTPSARALVLSAAVVVASVPAAGAQSLLSGSAFLAGRGVPIVATAPASEASGAGPSLFAGRAGGSLFAPRAPRVEEEGGERLYAAALPMGAHARPAERIRHLIADAEAGRHGYDAVQHGARRRPDKVPTRMTIEEIYRWIVATPGQPHAIGRYQFIPATLRRLVRKAGIDTGAVFTPEVQDRLADVLLEEAGLSAIGSGRMDRHSFMNNLAEIWAGLPNSSGRSHYHGYAGNRATMSWARFDAEMARIFPG